LASAGLPVRSVVFEAATVTPSAAAPVRVAAASSQSLGGIPGERRQYIR